MSPSLWTAFCLYAFAQIGIPLFGWAYVSPPGRDSRLRWTTFAAFLVMSLSLGVVLLAEIDRITIPFWLKVLFGLMIMYSYLVGLFAFICALSPPPANRKELRKVYGTVALMGAVSLLSIIKAYFQLGFPLWAVLALFAAHAVFGWYWWQAYTSKRATLPDFSPQEARV